MMRIDLLAPLRRISPYSAKPHLRRGEYDGGRYWVVWQWPGIRGVYRALRDAQRSIMRCVARHAESAYLTSRRS